MTDDDILKIADECGLLDLYGPPTQVDFIFFALAIAAKEREVCAALAEAQRDSEEYGHAKHACNSIAEAIRARWEVIDD